MKNKRNSSIELLKILGLILIVLSHAVPFYGDKSAISYININMATSNISEFILIVFKNIGQIGNIIFIASSAYFLLESQKTKVEKIVNIIMDCFIISITYLLIYVLAGIDISMKEILKQFLPITFKNNWFIGCYILLYILHPFLNKIIYSVNKKTLLRINMFLIIGYCLIALTIGSETYYHSQLIDFIIIYFIVAYNKLYLTEFSKNEKYNKILLIIGTLGALSLLVLTNILGLKIEIFKNVMLHWNHMNNIFYIMIGISMLNIFTNKYFENKTINYISSLSLLFYVIHENSLFRNYTKPLFYQHVFQYGNILMWVLIESLLLIIYGIIISIIYDKTLHKLTRKFANWIFKILNNLWDVLEKHLLKIQ